MYITVTPCKKASGKTYETVLLRESYRENGKVKNRTLANLSNCSPDHIETLKLALSARKGFDRAGIEKRASVDYKHTCGLSVGGVYVLHQIAKRLGICDALGNDFNGHMALWQVFARVLEQGSRLSATRLGSVYDIASVIGLKRGFDENDLYGNLHWLEENQERIERELFKRKQGPVTLFLYDVTSSYFEGMHNELALYGYNRDQKKRKKQIVIGLLCDQEGSPLSVEVFEGNTQDVETFIFQVRKAQERFGARAVTFVGDRGMIKSEQIEEVKRSACDYITALTLPQMTKLFKDQVLVLEEFTDNLKEITCGDTRYVYRRSPERAKDANDARQERLGKAQEKVDYHNKRLLENSKTKLVSAKRQIKQYLQRLCLDEWVSIDTAKRQIRLVVDEDALKAKSKFDGCYVLRTSLLSADIQPSTLFARYKDLSLVESAFRTCKTTFLEMRPIHVRKAASTRGHVFVVMLAYMLVRELTEAWKSHNLSVKEALSKLNHLCTTEVEIPGIAPFHYISSPDATAAALLDSAQVSLPTNFEKSSARVVSRHRTRRAAKI